MIDLSIGTVDTAPRASLELIPAARYAPAAGLTELRDLIALEETVARESVIVTAGAASGLTACFSLLRSPGKVLLPHPFFPSYPHLARIFGLEIAYYDASQPPDESTLRDLDEAIDDTCRCVVWNYPHNPTGHLDTHLDMTPIAEKCSKVGAMFVSDRVYDELILDEALRSGLARPLLPGEVRLKSFSKSYGLAGERVGYALAEESMVSRLCAAHWSVVGSTSRAGQLMAIQALKSGAAEWLDSTRADLRGARDWVHGELSSIPGFHPNHPGAGVFFWLRTDEGGQPMLQELLNAGVRLAPGDLFGDPSGLHFRMCFAVARDVMEEALIRIRSVANRCFHTWVTPEGECYGRIHEG